MIGRFVWSKEFGRHVYVEVVSESAGSLFLKWMDNDRVHEKPIHTDMNGKYVIWCGVRLYLKTMEATLYVRLTEVDALESSRLK
jgi:hypothetical protein